MKNILLVFLGGGSGSIIRYLLSLPFASNTKSFPFPTFIVNIIGCAFIGILLSVFMKENSNENWKLFLITGFCGGFTTFSAFSKESFIMIQNQQWGMFILYAILSVVLCIGATALGYFIAR